MHFIIAHQGPQCPSLLLSCSSFSSFPPSSFNIPRLAHSHVPCALQPDDPLPLAFPSAKIVGAPLCLPNSILAPSFLKKKSVGMYVCVELCAYERVTLSKEAVRSLKAEVADGCESPILGAMNCILVLFKRITCS